MLADLPTRCTTGAKLNAKGHMTSWIGYKLHIDVADGDIPISCLLTSALLHDSQAAIPLATLTASRAVYASISTSFALARSERRNSAIAALHYQGVRFGANIGHDRRADARAIGVIEFKAQAAQLLVARQRMPLGNLRLGGRRRWYHVRESLGVGHTYLLPQTVCAVSSGPTKQPDTWYSDASMTVKARTVIFGSVGFSLPW
jgi:hypothetical protein